MAKELLHDEVLDNIAGGTEYRCYFDKELNQYFCEYKWGKDGRQKSSKVVGVDQWKAFLEKAKKNGDTVFLGDEQLV